MKTALYERYTARKRKRHLHHGESRLSSKIVHFCVHCSLRNTHFQYVKACHNPTPACAKAHPSRVRFLLRRSGIEPRKTGATATVFVGEGELVGSMQLTKNGSGTVNGNLTAKQGASARLSGATIKAGATTVKSLDEAEPGLLKELSVSGGLIAGTGRASSLADGLEITSESDLMIKSMTMTADNKISVGEHTITLQDVTIKNSDDVCSLLNGIFTIDLKTLINCDLVMENVLLNASDLTLPDGFDPAKDAVAFDFGTDVTIQQATGLDMRLRDYWSSSLNLATKGQVIFTKLVPVPEPATGTLGMLTLAALAARRRRK